MRYPVVLALLLAWSAASANAQHPEARATLDPVPGAFYTFSDDDDGSNQIRELCLNRGVYVTAMKVDGDGSAFASMRSEERETVIAVMNINSLEDAKATEDRRRRTSNVLVINEPECLSLFVLNLESEATVAIYAINTGVLW